mgnify:CR=1 FL=1
MKKNGFTLIEILGVIVILSVIAIITIPLIDRTINKGKKNMETAQKAQLIKALKDYYADYSHSKTLNSGESCQTINTLVSDGYLDNPVNPMTKNKYDDSDKVCVKKTGSSSAYEYQSSVKYEYYVEIGGTRYSE